MQAWETAIAVKKINERLFDVNGWFIQN